METSVDNALRSRLRHAGRLARRVVDGSAGLSPLATALWLRDRNVSADLPTATSTTVAWADERRNTRLWVHNYWTESHRIAGDLTFVCRLRSADGSALGTRSFTLAENATAMVDVRDWLAELGSTNPFCGLIETAVAHPDLIPGLPLQAIGEYLDETGGASSVHGQFGLADRPFAQVVGLMRVAPAKEGRTGVVVANTFAHDRPAGMRVTVTNADGAERSAALEPMDQWASAVVMLDELFSDLDRHIGDRAGVVEVKYPFPAGRTLTFTERPDGVRLVDHGTIDRRYDQAPGLPVDWTVAPVCSVAAEATSTSDTIIVLPNVWGPVVADHVVAISLYDHDGGLVDATTTSIAAGCTAEVSLRDIAVAFGQHLPFAGHAVVRLENDGLLAEQPAIFDILVRLTDGLHAVSEVQVGAAFFNTDQPPGALQRPGSSTRVFGRVELGQTSATKVAIGHPRADDTDVNIPPAAASLRLVAPNGEAEAEVEVTIPANGSIAIDIAETFPDWTDVLGADGVGVVKVRSTDARLYGYYRIERDGAPTFGMDHLLGG